MKIFNFFKLSTSYKYSIHLLVLLQPLFFFSQNTATVSGDWNDCNTWGNPLSIFRNTTDTKTINNGIIVTANENWSTSAINLSSGSAINFSGSTLLDFTIDQGADKNCICGAFVAPGVFKEFMCHNLGADTSADPFTPSAAIHGGKYFWGVKDPAFTQTEDQINVNGVGNAWLNQPYPGNDAWQDNVKTANDPCPSGFKVPSKTQWEGVAANNTITILGTANENSTNYGYAFKIGNMLLPAAGIRGWGDNYKINGRGNRGYYWSSTWNVSQTPSAYAFFFSSQDFPRIVDWDRRLTLSVRCITQ